MQKKTRAEFEANALPHLDAMYAVALRLTRSRSDAEDLVQEAMLRAYRFWSSFTAGTNCKAWLLRIVTNTFLTEYGRQKRGRAVLDLVKADAETQATAPDPRVALDQRAIGRDVQAALDALPPEFRAAVVLCDVEELSYKEIADALDCPVGTVMSRLHRGRKLLQARLTGRDGDSPSADVIDLQVVRKLKGVGA